MSVTFTSHLSSETSPLNHVWEHSVGSGRALLALRADWQEQLRRYHDELGFRYVRFHALLGDDIGIRYAPIWLDLSRLCFRSLLVDFLDIRDLHRADFSRPAMACPTSDQTFSGML